MADITFRGTTYSSVRKLAAAYGAHYGNVVRRLRSGWSIEQALGLSAPPSRKAHNAEKLVSKSGQFSSIREAAKTFGIKEATIANRLRLGWSVDEALGLVAHPKPDPIRNRVVCAGHEHSSTASFAKHYGQNVVRVRKRLLSGWTPEQAVDLESSPPRFRDEKGAQRDHAWTHKVITKEGSLLPATVSGAYRLYAIRNTQNGKEYVGITTNDLKARLRGHWRLVRIGRHSKLYNAMRKAEQANNKKAFVIELIRYDAKDFTELQEQEIAEIERRDTVRNGYNTAAGGSIGTSKQVLINGELFPSQQAAATFYGIDPQVFSLRITRLGWSPEKAADITEHQQYQHHKVEVRGQVFGSLKEAARHFGMDYGLVHSRYVTNGWTVEESLDLAPAPNTAKFRRQAVSIDGIEFPSTAEASRHFGVKPRSVRNRIKKKGESAEDAIKALRSRL